jgi:hypothetical protein
MPTSPWWTWVTLNKYPWMIVAAVDNEVTKDDVWSALSALTVVDPMNYGATGDGVADDTSALTSAIAALPAGGGIVWLPLGKTFKKTAVIAVTKSHVKFWAPNGQASISAITGNAANKQSLRFTGTTGAGVFGVKFTSDATSRGSTKDDHQVVFDGSSENEAIGLEIAGSKAVGIFLYGATTSYVEGNYIHHTYADHVHHTAASAYSWVWSNWMFNESPSNGDDGIACITYGSTSPRGHDMEWWDNNILHGDGGRGITVVGGDSINIHDNTVQFTYAAGILIASEPGYDSGTSSNITVARNVVYRAAHTLNSHSAILVSGRNDLAAAVGPVTLTDNIAWGQSAQAFRTEGATTGITNTGLLSSEADIPVDLPTVDDVAMADTSILKTRDASFVASNVRTGLYRIHVRRHSGVFEQRFEYIVKGPPTTLHTWATARVAAGDYVSDKRTIGGTGYALLLTSAPVALGVGLSAVTHTELRTTALDWLWEIVDSGDY